MTITDLEERDAYLALQIDIHNVANISQVTSLLAYRLQYAEAAKSTDEAVMVATLLAQELVFINQMEQADSLMSRYLLQESDIKEDSTRASLYARVAQVSFFVQNIAKSIHYDTLALQLIRKTGKTNSRLYLHTLKSLGRAYNSNGDFVDAALVLTKFIDEFSVPPGDSLLLLETYRELGIVYSQIGLYDKALEYLDRHKDFGNFVRPVDRQILAVNTARNLLLTKDFTAARDRYLSSLSIFDPNTPLEYLPCYSYNGLVEAHYYLGNKDSVNFYFRRLDGVYRELGQPDFLSFIYRQSQWLNNIVNGNYAAAKTDGEALYADAVAKNDGAEIQMYLSFLSDTYRKQGDYRNAERYTRRFMEVKDSVMSVNRNNALLLYYNQFETKEKENQILLLDSKRERAEARRNQYQTIAGLLGLILLTGLLFYLQLRKARQKLARQNKELTILNQTKDRFFGIIAHDIRNPIAALGSADRQINYLYDKDKPEVVRQTVGLISLTVNQLSDLLDNLLNWALGQSGAITIDRAPQALHQFAQDNLDLYAGAAEVNQLKLQNETLEDTRVNADYNALQTILRNFVSNAIKFSPAQGCITVSHCVKGSMDVVSVTDQGQGISPTARAQLFKLHRGTGSDGRRKSGTGLGLILCKELAELHGGKVELVCPPEGGTVASVWLPKGEDL